MRRGVGEEEVPAGVCAAQSKDEDGEGVRLSVRIEEAVNLVFWNNRFPVLSELLLINETGERLGDVVVEVTCTPPVIQPRSWWFAEVGPGEVRSADDPELMVEGDWLGRLTEGVRGRLDFTVRAEGRRVGGLRRDIRFLPADAWGGSRSMPELLAAFVEPNDPAVSTILHKASDLLRAQGLDGGLEGYQTGSRRRFWEQAAAVWSAVCSLDLRYANPPPSFEREGQRIRPPRRILAERLATCLDLAVLFAACLEHAGFRPLIVLTEEHALAGFWLSRRDFGTTVADDAPNLRTRFSLHDLLVFETTLCTQTPAPDFKQACAAAAEHLTPDRDEEFECVIDIHRARQRGIRPLAILSGTYGCHPAGEETATAALRPARRGPDEKVPDERGASNYRPRPPGIPPQEGAGGADIGRQTAGVRGEPMAASPREGVPAKGFDALRQPPPVRDAEGGEPPGRGAPPIGEAPPLRDDDEDDDEPKAAPPPRTPADRLARWRAHLLDLSARNRLLNLKPGSAQALLIDCPDPVGLAGRLADMRVRPHSQPLRFRSRPDPVGTNASRQTRLQLHSSDPGAARTFALEALERGELLVAMEEEKLQTILTRIFRNARNALQEGGVNTLHLTIGTLLWKQKGKDKPYHAPLILIPVTLARPDVRSGFQLHAHQDESHVNTTLLEMLRQEYGIRIPENEMAAEGGEEPDAGKVLGAFRKRMREMQGWEVKEEVTLTNLSFAKYLMWKDLADETGLLHANEVVHRLMGAGMPASAGSAGGHAGAGAADHAGAALDDDPHLRQVVCPMEADSSQLRAVAAAAQGKSFVLIGPPGTGKSQTITNIIANALAHGRSVLFVAEKRAALEVVRRRLHQVGLDDFCLDLFSSKASKLSVLEHLQKSLQSQEVFSRYDWARAQEEVVKIREELNAYVRELHRKWPNGWTPYRAIGVVLRARTERVPEIAFPWPSADAHDERGYQGLRERVEEAAGIFSSLGGMENCAALKGIDVETWSPAWQREFLRAAGEAVTALRRLQESLPAVRRALALPAAMPLTPGSLAALQRLATRLLDPTAPEAAGILGADAEEVREALGSAAAIARAYADLAGRLEGEWNLPGGEGEAPPWLALLEEWRDAGRKWWLKRWVERRRVRGKLAAFARRLPADPSRDLERLIAMEAKAADLAPCGKVLAGVFGRRWQGLRTDFAALGACFEKAEAITSAFADCTADSSALAALRERVRRLLGEPPGPSAEGMAALRAFTGAMDEAKAALGALAPLCGGDPAAIMAAQSSDWPEELASRLEGWVASGPRLREWCAWRGLCRQAVRDGLSSLLMAMEEGRIVPGDALRVFEANYARWWLDLAVSDLPRLLKFTSATHEKRIERFRELDRRMLTLDSRLARSSLVEMRGRVSEQGGAGGGLESDFTILRKEFAKRRRHLPIRQLFRRASGAIRRLTPCVMMSPLSVAQYLPADMPPFDLVIFDEASQIPTWDAIGTIRRGKQVIVAGDPKQLPPTRFFERSLTGAEEFTDPDGRADPLIQDLESILDECRACGIPELELTWHYRSRHEGLIAFPNHQYYGGRLVTFPSPVVKDTAVSLRFVEKGVYGRAGGRTNPIEAQEVVAEVIGRLRRMAEGGRRYSIGIVTFNIQQQSLIEDMLDTERRNDPSLEEFFSEEHCEEPVFVKNLESVQGEERDVIIFSLTYGRDANGRMTMNFGPLNQDGGPRRLNVAITRAREALLVFSSIRADDIDTGRIRAGQAGTGAGGVSDLKKFLMFAERGIQALRAFVSDHGGDFESPFEAEVAEKLRARGWTVHPQIGVSGFRVDLGIVDPDRPGAFLAGIECDGATYHRFATARDRDRLRQSILEGLGWRILRIWSTDWWMNSDSETERIHRALVDMLEKKRRETRLYADPAPAPRRDERRAAGDVSSVPDGVSGTDSAPHINRGTIVDAEAEDRRLEIVCPSCLALNRVPARGPAAEAKCGACHQHLFTAKPIEVDAAAFRRHVEKNHIPVLVHIWAPWCDSCRMTEPAYEQAAVRLEPRVRLLRLNSDEHPKIARELGVRRIPALFLFHRGLVIARTRGVLSTTRIVSFVARAGVGG